MKYIITEEQNKALIKLSRVLNRVDSLVPYYMKDFEDMCDIPFKDYCDLVAWIVFKDLEDRELENFDRDEIHPAQRRLRDYIETKYHDILYNYYKQKCEK